MLNVYKEKLFILFKRMKEDKRNFLIAMIGITGIFLIFFSEIDTKSNEVIKDTGNNIINEEIECERLERIISEVNGVGKVKVMITYEGSSESVYALNESQYTKSNEVKSEEEYVVLDNGNTEGGLLRKEIFPKVIGVAVVCQGGGKATVKKELTQMLRALYSISSNNISISEMNF